MEDAADTSPILIVPYMWIGDFVRGHTVVRVLKQRWPNRPVDLLVTPLCAPLVDYMPGVRAGIVWNLPRGRLALAKQWGLAAQLRARGYGTALVLPRTWKAAIAPALAGIPERVGFFGEARFGLINRMRWGEKALPRFIDKNAALARGARIGPRVGRGPRGGPGAGFGRRLQALDLLSRGRKAFGRAWPGRLGDRRPRRKSAGTGDRGKGRSAGA